MTSAQYRAALAALGLTQAGAAELMNISVRTSNGYANGWPIPKLVELWLAHRLELAENTASRLSRLGYALG